MDAAPAITLPDIVQWIEITRRQILRDIPSLVDRREFPIIFQAGLARCCVGQAMPEISVRKAQVQLRQRQHDGSMLPASMVVSTPVVSFQGMILTQDGAHPEAFIATLLTQTDQIRHPERKPAWERGEYQLGHIALDTPPDWELGLDSLAYDAVPQKIAFLLLDCRTRHLQAHALGQATAPSPARRNPSRI